VRPLNLSDRGKVRVFLALSIAVLAAAVVVRLSAPSPFAPRVHVRWSPTLPVEQRATLERRFSLVNGERREDETWAYDLVNLELASVTDLIEHPAVEDTHYIDRTTGAVAADAPAGTVRLSGRRLAGVVHSLVFDWFLLFWASSVVVAGVRLASDEAPPD
jgi:hypothetical protein